MIPDFTKLLIKSQGSPETALSLLAKNLGVSLHINFFKRNIGYSYLEQTQYLRVFIAQLRGKIEDNPSKPELLITESGIGYGYGN